LDNKIKLILRIEELKIETQKKFKGLILPDFYIEYSLNSVDIFGLARHDLNEMTLNEYLLNENPELYISEIVEHEFAHFVVRALYPTRINNGKKVTPHGKEFKYVCKKLGIKSSAATTDAFENSPYILSKEKKLNRWNYVCGCSTPHNISTRKHNLIQNKNRIYLCIDCNKEIVFNEKLFHS